MPGIAQHITRTTSLYNYPVVHEHQVVANFTSKTHFMSDNNHGHAIDSKLAHHIEHFTYKFWVKG